jgi:outer membrane protein TolC
MRALALDAAIDRYQAALAQYQQAESGMHSPLTSRNYADYAQAALDLRAARAALEAAQRKLT